MRIVGGAHRGRAIAAPTGLQVRPTSDRAREALFNILAHADFGAFELQGVRVLDLFAGTGALGLEALSRGAAFALFVEEDADARAAIRENIEMLHLTGNAKIYKRDATKLGPRPGSVGPAFGLVLIDPPYGKGLAALALVSALEGGWLGEEALCVVEEAADAKFEAPEGFEEIDRRKYGISEIIFLKPVRS